MHVVFLQGMPSPFFSRIGLGLAKLGCKVTGINLCAGDMLFWKGGDRVNYRGKHADWPGFVARYFEENKVTDLVLLGEQRDYHKQAVTVAQELGVRVIVTDFGYLRPNWITLEQDGMSANSRFPREPGRISEIAANAPQVDFGIKYHDGIFEMAKGDLIYSFSNVLLWWLFPHYRRSDRRAHPAVYFPFIGWRLLRAKAKHKAANKVIEPLLKSKAKYFLFPMQLAHDFQVVAYSPFESVEEALEQVIKSFASAAREDVRLVFKVHPWDPGFVNWRKKITRIAKDYGVAARIDYVEGGNLGDMIRGSLGMVTINSTSGIQALQIGRPVLTLGEAIYNVPGLVYDKGLDNFWKNPGKPDHELVRNFINAIADTIQLRGVFFSEPGLTHAVEEAAKRIYQQKVGIILPETVLKAA